MLTKSLTLRPSRLLMAAAFAGVAACTALIDNTVEQCETDADCQALAPGSVCSPTNTCILGGQGGSTVSSGGGGEGGTTTSMTSASGGGNNCADPNDPNVVVVDVEGPISTDQTLSCGVVHRLKNRVLVNNGAELTIEAGTTIVGEYLDPGTPNYTTITAALVIQRGATILASGEPDAPIVFTSERTLGKAMPAGDPIPGDWGGVILLGRATINATGNEDTIEGITMGGEYGGNEDGDSSGVMRYMRIEYAGTAISANNEINGLTFGGVGSGTVVDFIEVRQAVDDCFEFFGGTVTAKHLICQHNGDDGIDWDQGWRGKLQFAVVQQDPTPLEDKDSNGYEADNDGTTFTKAPRSNPSIYNVTLVGKGSDVDTVEQYGMLLREGTQATLANHLVVGFEAGWDVQDTADGISLTNSLFFDNSPNLVAYVETMAGSGPTADDDGGFDEIAFFNMAMNMNATTNPMFAGDPYDADDPGFFPTTALTTNAAVPPAGEGFDANAEFIGAFRDASDRWDQPWAVWSGN